MRDLVKIPYVQVNLRNKTQDIWVGGGGARLGPGEVLETSGNWRNEPKYLDRRGLGFQYFVLRKKVVSHLISLKQPSVFFQEVKTFTTRKSSYVNARGIPPAPHNLLASWGGGRGTPVLVGGGRGRVHCCGLGYPSSPSPSVD